MSARPTFLTLIVDYGNARWTEGADHESGADLKPAQRRAAETFAVLTKALRRAGIPLDGPAT